VVHDSHVIQIRKAENERDLESVRRLFLEYRDTPGVGVCVVSFDEELARLPGKYQAIWIASMNGADLGCAAMRRIDESRAEMKRLYVNPAARGSGMGRELAEAVLDEARRLGCQDVLLDTLPSMTAAQQLYASLGFTKTSKYYENAPAESMFYQLRL